MIRPIVTDAMLLARKSTPATKTDLPVVTDLMDTVRAHRDSCVGMAANMIGVTKRIIVIQIGELCLPMLNPVIRRKFGEVYEAEEGCLSHTGVKKTKRYSSIEVEYQDTHFRKQKQVFTDFTAQVIQHEVDHCDGILI